MKIFVTGAAGMIGSNVVKALLADSHTVVGVDNYWRGKAKNLEESMHNERFQFRHADLISDDDWYFDITPQDVVLHIADIVAGIGYVFNNEWGVFRKNILINSKLSAVVRNCRPAKVIYLGTACSYPKGMQMSVTGSILSEKDKFPGDPESGYGWSKLMGQIELTLAVRDSATKLITLDLHNVYGSPCEFKGGTAQVIPSLIRRSIECSTTGTPLVVWGNGHQGRAFVHVDDVVRAIAMAIRYTGDQSTFMIGPNECTTIRTVVQVIKEHPRIKISEVVYDESKPTGDIGRSACFDLAKKELGWSPQVDFRDGVHRLIDWILDNA
jgi:GDP-D-mannose 3',5'-epimerase